MSIGIGRSFGASKVAIFSGRLSNGGSAEIIVRGILVASSIGLLLAANFLRCSERILLLSHPWNCVGATCANR